MSRIATIQLPEADREKLEKLIRDRNTPQKVVWRSRIVLLSAQGLRPPAVAAAVGKSELTVRRWRRRYLAAGVAGLVKDATRPPGKTPLSAEVIKQVVDLTLHEVPPGRTRWSERTMAARVGIAPSSVHAIWKAHGLKPHLTRTFKLSRDPAFTEKVEDIVGLYLNPPDKALVLSVDEKSQIQALDRTQPGLPIKKGRAGTMTHDYKRHGTTTLFAALNVLDGTVIGECMPRHRHSEFLRFLKRIDRETPAERELHLILDNYAPTRRRGSNNGSRPIRGSTCTSRRPRPLGSTWSNASSVALPRTASAAACSRASPNWRALSWLISISTTPIPNPSSGPSPPAKSSKRSPERSKLGIATLERIKPVP